MVSGGIYGGGGGMTMGPGASPAPWLVALAAFAAAVVLGVLVGFIAGKQRVRAASKNHKPLLTRKERLLYIGLFAAGAALVIVSVFVRFPQRPAPEPGFFDQSDFSGYYEETAEGEGDAQDSVEARG
ncbi:MAG: hypothetical protein FWH02_09150 [Oscillospiraceae bacterium]|nr:hypothetical protein [Oscillospiraceae bacterium]